MKTHETLLLETALDDKIELNRRMNETLEAMARAIFKSWFVDFDPVKAKAEGKTPKGCSPEMTNLFPDSFTDSDLGPIPTGWRIGKIDDVSETNARTLGKDDHLDVIEYVEISQVNRGDIAGTTVYRRGKEPSRARRRLRHGDTVLSTVRPERKAYFLCLDPSEQLIASTGFAVVSPHPNTWAFVHSALTMPTVFDYLGHIADGGAYPAVRPEIISSYEIVIPSDELIASYHQQCAPLYETAALNRRESRTLASIRDALLPKLLGGEIRIKGKERFTQ